MNFYVEIRVNDDEVTTPFIPEFKDDLREIYHIDGDLFWEAFYKHHNTPRSVKVRVIKVND